MRKIIGYFFLAATLFTVGIQAQEYHRSETIVGIGATLEKQTDGTVRVNALIANAPAVRAGLAIGDFIVEVRSLPTSEVVDVRSLPLPEVVALIRGPIGVPVEITYIRDTSVPTMLSIAREEFEVDDGQ